MRLNQEDIPREGLPLNQVTVARRSDRIMTKDELIAFEQEIADAYCAGQIRAPIHLSDGNEEQLLQLFQQVRREDWVFSTWRSHYHALLHGIPRDRLREKIFRGDSITIMDAEYRFFATAIVGGNLPIALGVALGEKRLGSERHVWTFVGDMGAMTGAFHEAVQYAENWDLPMTFVIEDNSQSVGTPTRTVWGLPENSPANTMPERISPKVLRYHYRTKWPHVGAGKFVQF